LSAKNKLRSRLLRAYIDPRTRKLQRAWSETTRKASGGSHVVSAFLQLDDPYSYLLSRYLPALAEHYDAELRVYVSEALRDEYQPAPDLLAEYAVRDCARVASELGVPFLDKGEAPPVEYRRGLLDALAAHAGDSDFADKLRHVLELYWRGDNEVAARYSAGSSGAADEVLQDAQKELGRLGHYNSAMLHYGGEWFWGVDRLSYLTDRLDELGLAKSEGAHPQLASIRQVMHVDLPFTPPAAAEELPPLELFYSFRSPYSQLCLRRVYELADAFGLQLVLRPVLPMMMRGMAVPPRKLRYIIRDAMREAETFGIPFGDCMDPLGEGVERCHAIFAYAQSEKRGREFLLNASELIWANAVDAATDKGMRKITAKTGLFWPEAKQAIENDDWREEEAANRQLMLSLGSWGVPTVGIGDYVVWGQDRIWLLARHIEELCDTGEGILV